MGKGGESLGNEEGSEEEEEVIPAENHAPRVRLLTLGAVFFQQSRRITSPGKRKNLRTVRNAVHPQSFHAVNKQRGIRKLEAQPMKVDAWRCERRDASLPQEAPY